MEKLVRVHLIDRSKPIVRPADRIRIVRNTDDLVKAIEETEVDEDSDVCCFPFERVESVEVLFGVYAPRHRDEL